MALIKQNFLVVITNFNCTLFVFSIVRFIAKYSPTFKIPIPILLNLPVFHEILFYMQYKYLL